MRYRSQYYELEGKDMNEFIDDLITFVGRRIQVAHEIIRPKLAAPVLHNNLSQEEVAAVAASIESEAIYLMGLADSLELAQYITLANQCKE